MGKACGESITDYIIRAENAVTLLKKKKKTPEK